MSPEYVCTGCGLRFRLDLEADEEPTCICGAPIVPARATAELTPEQRGLDSLMRSNRGVNVRD